MSVLKGKGGSSTRERESECKLQATIGGRYRRKSAFSANTSAMIRRESITLRRLGSQTQDKKSSS